MSEPASARAGSSFARRLLWLLLHPRLPVLLAASSTLVLAPTLALGFHLDDYVHRYLFSGLPGSEALLHAYQSPFGIANGDPASNQFQIEAGYAPWWTHPRLLISLWRPLSELSHYLDAQLFPASAPLQHAHSLVFHFGLVFLATRLYRNLLGTTSVAGLAAFMYAFDQAHGFAAGWIANRNALICAFFGIASLLAQHRLREASARPALGQLASPLLLLAALLSGEGAVAVFGYLLGYALFVERGPLRARLLTLAPHTLVVVAWRMAYTSLGRGAAFSGLYLDPFHEPARFAAAAVERVPILLLGQLALPPAEAYQFVPRAWAVPLWLFALFCLLWCVVSMLPLVVNDRRARFFAFGAFAALVPACTTHPNNRLLFFVGLGVMPLLSQLWHGLVEGATWLRSSRPWRMLAQVFAGGVVAFHLLLSPLLLPISAWEIALTSGAEREARAALGFGAGRDLVILNAPDYFYVKLIPVLAALERRSPPRRIRALSFGAVPLVIVRLDASTLDVRFPGGLLAEPLLELYRAKRPVMPPGSRVTLAGLDIEVEGMTEQGLISAARFRFDTPLDDPRFCILGWRDNHFVRLSLPAVGERLELPAAGLRFGL